MRGELQVRLASIRSGEGMWPRAKVAGQMPTPKWPATRRRNPLAMTYLRHTNELPAKLCVRQGHDSQTKIGRLSLTTRTPRLNQAVSATKQTEGGVDDENLLK